MSFPKSVYIKSDSKKHGYSLSLYGALALAGLIILYIEMQQSAHLPLMFLMACALLALMLGIFKIQEPEVSFLLNHKGVFYQHKRGFLLIEWSNIQRVGVPKITQGLEMTELAYVGIRLKDNESLLSQVSLRLMSHVLLEQRAVLHRYLRDGCSTCESLTEVSLNTDPYITKNGQNVKGLRGMFGHRMSVLKMYSGYDIFLPESSLDRPAHEFVKLLMHMQSESLTASEKNDT